MKEPNDIGNKKGVIKYSQLEKPIHSQCKFQPFFVYLIFMVTVLVLFLVNFLMTGKAFKDNRVVYLSADRLCNKTFEVFNTCLEGNAVDKCVYENRAVEDCYDDTLQLNRQCYIYLSELDLCVHKHKESNSLLNQCKGELDEVIDCGRIYSILKLDSDKLLSNIMSP